MLWYSTLTGITGAPLDVTVSSGTLILPLPELQTDQALKVIAQEK